MCGRSPSHSGAPVTQCIPRAFGNFPHAVPGVIIDINLQPLAAPAKNLACRNTTDFCLCDLEYGSMVAARQMVVLVSPRAGRALSKAALGVVPAVGYDIDLQRGNDRDRRHRYPCSTSCLGADGGWRPAISDTFIGQLFIGTEQFQFLMRFQCQVTEGVREFC